MEDNQLWVQPVSSVPCTRMDVIHLQEQLDKRLQERQARETGICPVRRELYNQCFGKTKNDTRCKWSGFWDLPWFPLAVIYLLDELIRQVTINCAERGLLLLQVRDENRMTIAAYQTLYESSVAFGMRKALQGEQGKSDFENKVMCDKCFLLGTFWQTGWILRYFKKLISVWYLHYIKTP